MTSMTSSISNVLRNAWRTLLLWRYAVWSWFRAHVHFHVTRKSVPEWRITSALAFCEDTGDFQVISHWFDPDGWEEDVDSFLGWKHVRVDVRYVHTSPFGKTTKYRMVLRNGDTCTFPPPPPGRTGPRGVLAARLVPGVPDASPVDVTTRVIKYAGPARDFHAGQGLHVRPLDCFPCDDHDALAERFAALVIVDGAAFREHAFSLIHNHPIMLPGVSPAKPESPSMAKAEAPRPPGPEAGPDSHLLA